MTTRRTYNTANDAWYAKHPTLQHLRQLSGVEEAKDSTLTEDDAAYAAEQGPVDPEEAVTDYGDRRGM